MFSGGSVNEPEHIDSVSALVVSQVDFDKRIEAPCANPSGISAPGVVTLRFININVTEYYPLLDSISQSSQSVRAFASTGILNKGIL